MRHKHHIIPKHKGGTNDISNLVDVTITQHAIFHYCEWRLHKKRADYIAWKALVGYLSEEEIIHQKLIMGGENGGKKTKELGVGIFALTKDQRSENSKKSGKIGGKKGGMSKSEKKINACKENIKKAVVIFMENDTPEKARERGIKGNKAQRLKLKEEGRTIAEQMWIVTTPDGENLQIANLKQFCRENNLLINKMCEVGKGKWKQHRGYSCKKIHEI